MKTSGVNWKPWFLVGLLAGAIGLSIWRQTSSAPSPAALAESAATNTASVEDEPPANARLFPRSRLQPAAPIQTDAAPVAPTNLVTLLMTNGEPIHISSEQAEAFVQSRHRAPESLLAAYQATGDRAFLREAMERYPEDPRVAFAGASMGAEGTPEEQARARRRWLDAFRKSDPDNALADYLSAREHFKAGNTEAALQEIQAAMNKPMRDYALDWIQNTEEAFRAAGYSDVDAKTAAAFGHLLPHLAEIRGASRSLIDLSKNYREAGDAASADAALQMAAGIGQRLDGQGSHTLLQSLVGVAIQRQVLGGLDVNTPFGAGGETVQTHLDRVSQRREEIRDLSRRLDHLMPQLSPEHLNAYLDRFKLYGDEAAARWLLNQVRQ